MELCAFRKHGRRALYCLCTTHECTLHAAAKLQHSSHYTCHIKIFRFIGIILSIAGMGQAFVTPSSIMPPLILPSRQTHLGHGDMVHSLTPIGLSMPSPLNGFIPASWQKNRCLYIIICCAVWPPSLAQKQIQFQCDKQSLVMVINKGSKIYWDAPTQMLMITPSTARPQLPIYQVYATELLTCSPGTKEQHS